MDYRNMTVATLFELWLEDMHDSVSKSTWKLYRFCYNQYVKKRFGKRKVKTLTPAEWTKLENSLADERGFGGELISASTVRQAIGMYHRVFEFGSLRYGLPSPIRSEYNSDTFVIFSREDVDKMTAAVQPFDIYHICIMLGLYTGIDFSEMCGLQWQDIDIENKLIKIRRTGISRKTPKGYVRECDKVPLKNEWNKRELPIPDRIMQQLEIMKESHDGEQFLLYEPFEEVKPLKFRDHYTKFLKKAGVEYKARITLRHTFAATCIENGMLPDKLSRLLGHRDVYVTYKQYGELIRRGGR